MARKKVTSVPALADWGAVDNALRDIRECQHTLAEMAVQRDRQIDSIKADYAQGALPLQNRVKALESDVKAYVDLHRAARVVQQAQQRDTHARVVGLLADFGGLHRVGLKHDAVIAGDLADLAEQLFQIRNIG